MRPTPLLSLLVLFLAGAVGQDIVFFGESLSDSGGYADNVKFVLRTTETYPEEPYYQGRWSNGPTWIEIAAQQLGKNLTNYAAGGATTGSAPAQVPPLPAGFAGLTLPTTVLSPTLPQQLNSHFLATNNTLDPSAVYFILIGSNDYLSTVFIRTNVTVPTVIGYIEDGLQQLYDHGARKFVLGGLPDFRTIPPFTQPNLYGSYPEDLISNLGGLTMDHNALLQELATSFPASHPGSTFNYFDFGAATMQVVTSPASFGITNIQEACYVVTPSLVGNPSPTALLIGRPEGQLCSDPDAHFYWDQSHPTRVVHSHIGGVFVEQLGAAVFGTAPASAPSGTQSAMAPSPALPTLASGS